MLVLTDCPAAPQPTPKHFTDEELKQQYGIHLATRLQADGDGKEAKWADIDDDEDDWAPETIEWNDGTKITLSQNDSAAILAEEQARIIAEKERQEEEEKAKLAAQQKSATTVGPNATVLKPRSAAQPKPGGLVLKAPSDKPTLVAKPSAPTPTRSPWAPLPPVDKVPPVEINPPIQSSTTRPQQPDNYRDNAMPPPAAMEIAADDFTRTKRDNQSGNLEQLYNAQSGQYEPANAGRRGSVRKDQNFRPPSLLQRGAARDQHEPAEPSAAFQTHRNQHDSVPWPRRGSSTVSGDSGPQDRRISMSKGSDMTRIPTDLLQQRRDSQHSQVLQSPSTPGHAQLAFPHRGPSPAQHLSNSAAQSPALQHSQLSQDARSMAGSPYQSRNAAPDQAAPTTRDDVAVQKQLMKEKRELAIKRKREEEEREEAAKKERIRLKMEALGMAPLEEKRELAKKEVEKKQIEKREPEAAPFEKKEAEKRQLSPQSPRVTAPSQDVSTSTSRSPPKPPAPDASGMPQQYGMMKLHGATSNNMPQPANERLPVEKTRPQGSSPMVSLPGLEPMPESTETLPSPRVNGVTPKHPDVPIYRAPDPSNQNIVRDARQQPWNNASRDPNAYTGWSGQGMSREPSASTSVWGPPSHARNLGNGTFDNRNIQRPQSRQQEQFPSPALEPIGPPRHLQRPREASELRPQELGSSPVAEDFQTIPTFPSDAPPSSHHRPELTGPQPNGDAHIAPPQFGASTHLMPQINDMDRPVRGPDQQRSTLAAWNNFQSTDAEKNRQAAQQHAAKMAEEARLGYRRPEPQLPIMNETWRQVKVDDEGGQRQIIGVQKAQNTHDHLMGPQINGDIQGPPFSAPMSMPPFTAAGIGRGSRFFPGAGTGMHPQYQNGSRFALGYRQSSSPPPPEDSSHLHPAYMRDSMRPTVNLPAVKEKPKVKLPPAVTTPMQSPQLTEVRAIPLRAASQPLVNNPSWQDRFNGLLGVKKPSPEKKFVHVVDFSATKVPLDSPPVDISASVSLPKNGETLSRTLEVASKAMEDEEALFENREFGSLPAVQIPTQTPEIGWSAVQAPKRSHYKNSKLSREIDSTSKEAFIEKEIISNGGVLIFVRMLGMSYPKSVALSRPGSASGPGSQNLGHAQSGPRPYQGRNQNKGFKPRESSGTYGNDSKNTPRGPPRNVPATAPPSQARPPSKNHPAWGARATNAVH